MSRLKIDYHLIDLAGWRRLVYFIFLLHVISDLLLRQVGTSTHVSTNKKSGLFFPAASGIAPYRNNCNSHLSRCQQNFQAGSANDNEGRGGNCDRVGQEVCDNSIEAKIKSKRRRAIEMIRSIKTSFGNKIVRNEKRPRRKNFFPNRTEQNCLEETTRLVGGANLHVEAEEDPQQYDSSASNPPNHYPETNERGNSFLRSIIPFNKYHIFWGESEVLRKNFQQTLALLHKVSSQAGPSVITVLSLLGNSTKKDDISFATLYTLALLGASCGFHLFLHFITLGYALGVTFPLVAALIFYQVRTCIAFESSLVLIDGC